jgi:hypothetical protein
VIVAGAADAEPIPPRGAEPHGAPTHYQGGRPRLERPGTAAVIMRFTAARHALTCHMRQDRQGRPATRPGRPVKSHAPSGPDAEALE